MKKYFKKIFGFCLTVALATFLFTAMNKQNNLNFANAVDTKTYTYTVKNNNSYIEVTGAYDEDSSSTTYTVGNTYTTFSNALTDIINDVNSETNTITINFDSFSLDSTEQTITLESSLNFVFSGNISSTNTSPVFTIYTTYQNSINFENIVITNNSCDHIIEVVDNADKSDTNRVSIYFESTNLCTTNQNGSYAIYLDSTYVSMYFGENFNSSSSYLYNYISGVNATLQSNFSFDTTTIQTETINITVPYNIALNNAIIYSNYSCLKYITFVPLSSYYTFYYPYTYKTSAFYASPMFYIDFDENGGNDYTEISTISKYTSTEISFPTSDDISKEHNTFVGWIGKLVLTNDEVSYYNLNSTTWYFNSTMLESFVNYGSSLADISTYFVTSLDNLTADDLSTEKLFSSYVYDSTSSSYETYLHATFFTNLEKIPTYIAIWSDVYEISFDSNDGTEVESIKTSYGTAIQEPTSPTKTGYTFAGWFSDESLADEFAYSFSTMPDQNITLYAKWTANTISITFVLNNGKNDIVVQGNYLQEIDYPDDPVQTGYSFIEWLDSNNDPFSEIYFGAEDIEVHASWEQILYTITYNSNGGESCENTTAYYNDPVTEPTSPTKTGYTFAGWYSDESLADEFAYSFSTMPAQNITLYAKWIVNSYTISFETNCNTTLNPIEYEYGETIEAFETISKSNYNFVDWYLDEIFETIFSYTTMPAENITLYALWSEKLVVEIDVSSQTYSITDGSCTFRNFSSLRGFSVYYLVDDTWVESSPSNAGTYDVKITRSEDATYQSFSIIIENGLVIEPEVVDVLWLIVLLFFFALAELLVIIVIKSMQRLRSPKMIGLAFPALIAANKIISNNQFILLIVSGVLALAGFVIMVLELVKWNRNNIKYNIENTEIKEKKDNFTLDEEFEEKFKTKHDDNKYKDYVFSQEDIEEMLKNPNYFKENNKLKDSENKKFNNISTNNFNNQISEDDDVFDLIDDEKDTEND